MLAFFSPPVILSVVAVIQLFCTQKLHVFARFLIIYRFSKDVKPKVLNFFCKLSYRKKRPCHRDQKRRQKIGHLDLLSEHQIDSHTEDQHGAGQRNIG